MKMTIGDVIELIEREDMDTDQATAFVERWMEAEFRRCSNPTMSTASSRKRKRRATWSAAPRGSSRWRS